MDQSEPKRQQETYRKIKVLGEGSMGKAYLVECSQDKKLYVMKRINIGHLSEQQRENAGREAKLHSQLAHQNIIAFKEIYHTTKDKLCIIMQYAQNGDLDQLLKQLEGKYLPQDTLLSYFTQICLGLRVIHQNKIIHRDLKGANIFITADGTLKIGDFGISKVLDKTVLSSKSFVGTPYYLSPEMVQGKPYSTKADIWALGVILYHMSSHRLPFETNSLPLLALKIIKGSFPPITGGNYSKQLKTLILNLLQVDQRKRPSINEILNKPFLSKYVPKEIIQKIYQKTSVKNMKIASNMNSNIPIPKKKHKASEEQLKEQDRVKRQQYKSKRQQMRKQMREDLKIKRKQGEKNSPNENNLEVNSSAVQLQTKEKREKTSRTNLTKLGARASSAVEQKKQHAEVVSHNSKPNVKPWKNLKVKSKKEIQVELFLPQDRPKPPKSQTKSQQLSQPPHKDFKVQIFVSGKPLGQQTSHDQQMPHCEKTKSNAQTVEAKQEFQKEKRQIEKGYQSEKSIQNYHYSQKNIREVQEDSQQYQEEEQIQEAISPQQNFFNDVLKDVKGVGKLIDNMDNPYKDIELYEESDNFDNTIEKSEFQSPQKYKMNAEDVQNLKYITNAQNLEQLRLILEDRLGQQNFVKAYNIIIEHATQSKECDYNEYAFNRQILKQKLVFLTHEQFDKNIVLLYTLSILEDEQMKNNFQIDEDD